MAKLRDVLANRFAMDAHLREREGHEYDALTPGQQRAAYIHARRVIHEIQIILQLARDGHTTARSDADVLRWIQTSAWAERDDVEAPAANASPADTIRSSWIRWLRRAPNEDVLRFHDNVAGLLNDTDEKPPSTTPAA
jgi:hypothetical protein